MTEEYRIEIELSISDRDDVSSDVSREVIGESLDDREASNRTVTRGEIESTGSF